MSLSVFCRSLSFCTLSMILCRAPFVTFCNKSHKLSPLLMQVGSPKSVSTAKRKTFSTAKKGIFTAWKCLASVPQCAVFTCCSSHVSVRLIISSYVNCWKRYAYLCSRRLFNHTGTSAKQAHRYSTHCIVNRTEATKDTQQHNDKCVSRQNQDNGNYFPLVITKWAWQEESKMRFPNARPYHSSVWARNESATQLAGHLYAVEHVKRSAHPSCRCTPR